jgi:uncharacterized protein (DUF4415 family)
MVMPVKQTATSKTFFSPEQIATARAAAAETPVEDAENPSTRSEDWDNAIVSHSYQELREKLTERRQIRGPQKAPRKEQVAIRLSPEVLAYFRATGKGWHTRMDAALKEWIEARN